MTAETQTYELNLHARFRVLDDEGVFVLQEAGEVVVINKVGALVVDALTKGRSLTEVIEEVTAEFEVERQTAKADVENLINDLLEAGALSKK